MATLEAMAAAERESIRAAVLAGYEPGRCAACSRRMLVRSGACSVCDGCGDRREGEAVLAPLRAPRGVMGVRLVDGAGI